MAGAVDQWLARCDGDPVTAGTLAWTAGRERAKDLFPVLSSQRLWRIFSAYFAFMCAARTKMITHVKNLMSVMRVIVSLETESSKLRSLPGLSLPGPPVRRGDQLLFLCVHAGSYLRTWFLRPRLALVKCPLSNE